MKGKLTATICFLMLSLVTFALVAQTTKAAAPILFTFAWVEPDYKGTDVSISGSPEVVGYRENTNWTFTMSWTNTYVYQINISAIRLYFSWGKNYTQNFATPVTVESYQTRTFTITNVTPNVTDTSEMWYHSFEVYIHHVNSTTAPMGEAASSPLWVHHGSYFMVLSSDHLDCLDLWSRVNGISLPSSSIAKVQVLKTEAKMEFDLGTSILEKGVYGQAKTHLQTAENLYNQALTTWDERGTAMEDADMNYTKSETAYNYALANAANVNAYGWLLFGLGWTFIGLGVIIYGLRRPKVAQS